MTFGEFRVFSLVFLLLLLTRRASTFAFEDRDLSAAPSRVFQTLLESFSWNAISQELACSVFFRRLLVFFFPSVLFALLFFV